MGPAGQTVRLPLVQQNVEREPMALIEEECGVDPARIRAWLDTRPDAGLACQMRLEELEPRTVGLLVLPRSKVTISGEPAACEELYRKFFLAFMSAGG